MLSHAHALRFSLGVWLAAVAGRAEEPLPPIFAARPAKPATTAPSPAKPRSPNSDYIRKRITDEVLANAKVFDVPGIAGASSPAGIATDEPPVLMDRVTVDSKRMPVVQPPPGDPPLRKFLQRGVLYENSRMDVGIAFVPLEPKGYGNREASTRFELRFNFRF